MNKLYHYLSLIAIALLFVQCEEPMDYKYADKPFDINCSQIDANLLREALYSFQDDIAAYYRDPDIIEGSKTAYIQAYRRFIFPGMKGELPYADMASPHTLNVLEKLKNTEGLWDRERKDTNLDYTSEFMSCLFYNIQDEDLKQHFASLRQVDYLSPSLMAESLRQQVSKAFNDEHLALYIALDGYYQYLLDRTSTDE